jgi:lactate dehydrogenase-like 2-hydroxyacid dehydrogenase
MARQDILLIGPLIDSTMAQLDAAYVVHRYDLAGDKDTFLAELAPRITAIATRGDYPLPDALLARLPHVRLIASSGTGYDGVDIESARRRGARASLSVAQPSHSAAYCPRVWPGR